MSPRSAAACAVLVSASAVVSACAAPTQSEEPADVSTELRAADDCTASVTVSRSIAASPERAYEYVAREDTPARDLRSYLLVPGVRGDEITSPGGWDHAGATRTVFLDFGASCVEQLDVLDAPARFAYHSYGYSFPLGAFISVAHGSWTFTPTSSNATLVTWTYTFSPTTCAVAPELRRFSEDMFRPYMDQAMASIAAHIEG
jgi:hypothetical protein